jgi:predicted HicB family RNase H-like nuclease
MTNDYGVLESRGYKGTLSYSVTDNVYHGKIVGVDDLITYEANSYEELVEEFKDAVLEYMDYIENRGKIWWTPVIF